MKEPESVRFIDCSLNSTEYLLLLFNLHLSSFRAKKVSVFT
ncbi:hypothetical protein LEP1GSC171_3047 [Leptospira santarosai str. HAI1380]|uniref:Uncharacterized protein n=1 Tax=Leptospira santarosai str. ZUN179 TaxID=1049985 RepID=M6UTG0_9LEPT|nr:hypothetical protein LEP1GSC039_1390 [Leptospira santarosai str. 2000027870]EMO46016.1 hypothetical protein LEP1GSC187_4015 [Leptospira santarosai str. ZUN179]EMP02113.1 hypothetical protein LEP1GSC171_3047 [Leptospira santarosai str. HAI1380]